MGDRWQSVRWPLLGLLGVAAFLLGHLGFREHFRLVDEPRTLPRTLYLSLQLFTLESGSLAPPTPWQLDVARFLAPAVSFSTVAATLATIFREQFGLVRLRFFRGHVVVCGLGQKGLRLAMGFRDAGHQVVEIERDHANRSVSECRRRGIVVLIGDASDPALLARARLSAAGHLIAVCGEDPINAQVAVVACRLVRGRRGVLRGFVHLLDGSLCRLLREREFGAREDRSSRLEFFNIYESGSRVLLRRFPPFDPVVAGDGRAPHMVVVGLGRLGRSIVMQAAELWRGGRGESAARFGVTVVDHLAQEKVSLLTAECPSLAAVCDLRAVSMDVRSAAFGRGDFLDDGGGRSDVDAGYVCLDDPGLAMDAGLVLLRHLPGDATIVVRSGQGSGMAGLLGGTFGNVHAFSLLEEACTPEILLGGVFEQIARAIHADYLARQRLEGQSPATNPAAVAWEELPEHLKESNRDQAADIGAKLAAVGCGVEPLAAWDADLIEFSPDEVELLAHMEHARWMAHRREAGWRFGAGPKDERRKTHPDLVPYEQLSEAKREYDREAVRGIPAFLRQAGFRVRRLPSAAIDTDSARR